jgi:hypothetical protein
MSKALKSHQVDFKKLWDSGIELPNLPDAHKGFGRKFNLKVTKDFYTGEEVRTRANEIRKFVDAAHPGKYSMQVTVRDRNSGQFKSAGFSNTKQKEFRIWSPDDYESEFDTKTPHKNKGLEANSIFIIFYQF